MEQMHSYSLQSREGIRSKHLLQCGQYPLSKGKVVGVPLHPLETLDSTHVQGQKLSSQLSPSLAWSGEPDSHLPPRGR